MATASGDFAVTMDELRVVARYVVESAEEVLPVFEDARPGDSRPRAAIDAAWEFVEGAKRSELQRVTSVEAHRAAQETPTAAARLAARSAGDAASAAYLHPIAEAHQVGHILRAASSAKLGKIPDGGGRRHVGRQQGSKNRAATPGKPRTKHHNPLIGTCYRIQSRGTRSWGGVRVPAAYRCGRIRDPGRVHRPAPGSSTSAQDYRSRVDLAQGMVMVVLGVTLTVALVRMRARTQPAKA